MNSIARAAEQSEVLTGLLYLASDAEDLHVYRNTYEARPFNQLRERDLCPGSAILEELNAALR
jgi:2-oxoglutarate ferredoxin oxidoreductase subunit beta